MAVIFETKTMRRVYWRLIPLLFAMMFFHNIDQINIGFAALPMDKDIGLSPGAFDFGAGLFFVGYVLFAIPSNLMLHRLGARRWIARILITWGAIAAVTAFAWNAGSFYALRFGLGVVEAGFLPGIAFYLTAWFPHHYRARAVLGYIFAGAIAAILGGPISTALINWLDHRLGLHGWQWMFIVEGLPAMLLGVVALCSLTDRPAIASWLSPDQRDWLEDRLGAERAALAPSNGSWLRAVAGDTRAWSLAAMFGCALVGLNGLLLGLPQIVKSLGALSDVETGLISAIPPALGMVGAIIVSRSSDRTGDRKTHLALVYALSAIGLVGVALVPNPTAAFAMLCVTGGFIYAGNPLFWSLAGSFRSGLAGAATIALVSTVAQAGGLIGPWTIRLVHDATGSLSTALLVVAGFLGAAVIIALTMRV